MTREQFDKLYKGKAVYCENKIQSNEFITLAESVGYVVEPYMREFDDICFYPEEEYINHSTIDYAERDNYEVVKFVSQKQVQEQEEKETTYEDVVQVILDYLGVKVDEEFKVKHVESDSFYEYIFTIDENLKTFDRSPNNSACWEEGYFDIIELLKKDVFEIIKIEKTLLTKEEKEFLKNFKFSQLRLVAKELHVGWVTIDLQHCKLKFENLEVGSVYSIEELGLED